MRVGAALLFPCFVAGSLVVSGCTRSATADPTAPAVSDTTTTIVTATSAPAEVALTTTPVTLPASVTTIPVTSPPEPVASTSPVPATTVAATTVPDDATPPVSTGGSDTTTTTEPIAQTLLVLSGDGIGPNLFGADPEGVIQSVTATLGGNTDDTGWVEPQALGMCPGTVARRVEWGTLKLWFSDSSSFTTDRQHFFAWEYGQVSELGGEPVGLHSAGGTTLGSSVSELKVEFPDAVVTDAPDDFDGPSTYSVSDTFYGWLTGPNPDDAVVVMFGGKPCG